MARFDTAGLTPIDEYKYVHVCLATLDLGNMRLPDPQPLCQLHLRQSGRLAQSRKPCLQGLVTGMMNGDRHLMMLYLVFE